MFVNTHVLVITVTIVPNYKWHEALPYIYDYTSSSLVYNTVSECMFSRVNI